MSTGISPRLSPCDGVGPSSATTNNMNATQELHNLGQNLWLDNITRDLLTGGTLRRYIDEFSHLGQVVVVVQVFAGHIVFRNFVSGNLCDIWISRIFDTVYGIRFERIAFFRQLLHTF